MNSGILSTVPMSAEHRERGFVGAAMGRAHRQAMPAAIQANGLAPEEPAIRTVEVEAFCSWSACRMKILSSVSQHRIDLVVLAGHREAHVQEVLGKGERVLRIHEGLA
jgi:folate-dependent phosphoribosylglycinamide formyltransferase PurN